MKQRFFLYVCLSLILTAAVCPPAAAQTITATLEGEVLDASGAAIPGATVTAVNTNTRLTRTVNSSELGAYRIALLPVGEYEVTVEATGFQRSVQKITLLIGQAATLDFSLAVGELTQEVVVQAAGAAMEPTRTEISSVIEQRQIATLPVSGRQFIDFALLAPGVTVGETTSGSTDVIIEPVTKLSFAGQNIHFNLVEVDGADNISTASGVQKTTPSQEAVQEFRVINTDFSVEAGRAVGGIVNIISKSGGNDWHGSAYWFYRNNAFDATSILLSPDASTCSVPGDISSGGCSLLDKLQQNQFGATIGGPIAKDRVFIFGNYEGQRRNENPFYNSVILRNIDVINTAKTTLFGLLPAGAPGTLPGENLNQIRRSDYDQFLVKLDASLSQRNYMFVRYFYNQPDLTNQSPLNDGGEVPSGFKDNFIKDQTLVGGLTTSFSPSLLNDLRVQYARRFFDFVTVASQPRLEQTHTFVIGINRGNPDFYKEPRFEIADSMTWTRGKHSLQFGGNFNWVKTTESFPLFYPFEAHFLCMRAVECPASFEAGAPFVLFFQRNDAAQNFLEPTLIPGTEVYTGTRIPTEIRNLAKGVLTHYYNGLFIQDKWRATSNLTLNFGVRYEWEDWPRQVLKGDYDNVDPRFGFAYNFGTSRSIVLRGGIGRFTGIIPSPLLMCQIPSCGGVISEFPGREAKQNDVNAETRLFAYSSDPFITGVAMRELLLSGTYPDYVDSTATLGFPCPEGNFFVDGDPLTHRVIGTLAGCAFFGDSVIVRFADDHEAPYGIQMMLALDFEVFKDARLSISYLRTKGLKLGSFYDINQGPDNGCPQTMHDSAGNTGLKRDFHVRLPGPDCSTTVLPFPSTAVQNIAVYFEADSRWKSVYDGLLINFNKRPTNWLGLGLSYTWSKSLDDGPNPSFVLIPQDANNINDKAISADHVAHRFVGNATISTPTTGNPLVKDWEFGTIVTLQSAHYFNKYVGFDSNGNVFDVNDRVGIDPRNTFKGDGLYSFDARVARSFNLSENVRLQLIAEGFNLFNSLNVRFFNTLYAAADFCPLNPTAAGCVGGPFSNLEGSPNPDYGTPRAINNPRQFQFAVRLTF